MMKYLKILENKKPIKEVKYYSNNDIRSISYKLNNEYHREDGPAFQSWYVNGNKYMELYYINRRIHREDGPAIQEWYKNGQKEVEKYYLNHNEYDRKDWLEKLKEMNSPHYKEQKLLYDMEQNMEKYNL